MERDGKGGGVTRSHWLLEYLQIPFERFPLVKHVQRIPGSVTKLEKLVELTEKFGEVLKLHRFGYRLKYVHKNKNV